MKVLLMKMQLLQHYYSTGIKKKSQHLKGLAENKQVEQRVDFIVPHKTMTSCQRAARQHSSSSVCLDVDVKLSSEGNSNRQNCDLCCSTARCGWFSVSSQASGFLTSKLLVSSSHRFYCLLFSCVSTRSQSLQKIERLLEVTMSRYVAVEYCWQNPT